MTYIQYKFSAGEGIDEESFKLIDDDTLKILIPKAGPRLKFKSYLKKYLSCKDDLQSIVQHLEDSTTLNDSSILSEHQSEISCVNPTLYEPSTSRNFTQTVIGNNEKRLDVRHIVSRKLPEILKKLDENDPDHITILDKYALNRLIVDTYIEKFSCTPTTTEKIDLAKDIIRTFPVLKGLEGEGFVSIST